MILRNPIDRMISNIAMKKRDMHPETMNITRRIYELLHKVEKENCYDPLQNSYMACFDKNHDYNDFTKGIYADILLMYLKYTSLSQIFVIRSEDFVDPIKQQQILKDVLVFLDLPQFVFRPLLRRKTNTHPHETVSPELRMKLTALYRPQNKRLEQMLNRSFNWG